MRQRQAVVHKEEPHSSALLLDASFNSRAKLLDHGGSRDDDVYDIEPLPGTEVVLGCETVYFDQHVTNMSAMSSHPWDHETVESRTISDDEDEDEQDAATVGRHRQDLLVQVLERLHDNVELVAEVEAMSESWFTKTPSVQQDGLVTGLERSVQDGIVRNVNAVMKQIPLSSDEDDDLREGLLYCRQLVYMSPAAKPSACYKVKDGIRAALGILPPESPEVVRRGGDSSVFSLPPDDHTPMTSNVSLTTTITTRHSPPRHVATTRGLQLRRTLETVLALLQVLSRACRRLGNVAAVNMEFDETRQVVDEIMLAYRQVALLDRRDLKSLLNAFEPVAHNCRGQQRRAFSSHSQPILPRAPAMTPPRPAAAWHMDDIFGVEEEGFEMEYDGRNPPNEGRLAANDGLRQGFEQQHLHLLAGVCTRIAEAE